MLALSKMVPKGDRVGSYYTWPACSWEWRLVAGKRLAGVFFVTAMRALVRHD